MDDIIPPAAQHEKGQLVTFLAKCVQQAQMKSGAFITILFPLRFWTVFWMNTVWPRASHNFRGYV